MRKTNKQADEILLNNLLCLGLTIAVIASAVWLVVSVINSVPVSPM